MSKPRKDKHTEIADDLESRGAGESEIHPHPFGASPTNPFDTTKPLHVIADTPEPSITVPSDSTEEPPQEKDLLAIILTCKQVSVTELMETGRGMRLYLGKPSMSTFENMLRRSKGTGVIIEPDPRQDGVAVEWSKWPKQQASIYEWPSRQQDLDDQ